jgi:hypothetical protein
MTEDERWRDDRFFTWVIFRVIFSIIILVIVINFVFNFASGRMMMFYPDWLWSLFGLFIFIWIISWLFRPWHYGYWGHEHEMRILRRRYARGEITEAQFKKMMKVLREEVRHKD